MLILLPPSETKTRPAEVGHRPLALQKLALPEPTEARETVLRAARRTAAGADAASRLGVPASAPELVGRMLHLELEPAGAPLEVYSGVLYDQLEPAGAPLEVYSGVLYDQLDPATAPPADRRVLVQSALLGLVDAARDRIPAYRLSATSSLSRLGKAGPWWAPRLKPVASALCEEEAAGDSPLVIDCRSGSYRSMMPLRSRGGVSVLEVSPVQERAGMRKVISHDAKRYRGLVTRALLAARSAPSTADELVDVVREGLAGQGRGPSGALDVELDEDRLVVVERVA